ncbi:2-oxoacid:acceptor oxidoreductase subunit alpha [Candidatus Woesebacteria bacterium]|nr:2-oxoacid:acceptor oxidoreductase subunit alpha [Candidatus Woesebacteria bacterium]
MIVKHVKIILMKFNWKIGGEAGFGIMTSGLEIAKVATRSGYHTFDYSEYPSLIRGGHNTYEVVISNDSVSAPKWEIDMLVCLNKDTFELHKDRLHLGSVILYDPEDFQPDSTSILIPIPFKAFKKECNIDQKMVNSIALGASLALLGGELKVFETIIRDEFGKKGEAIVKENVELAKKGYDYILKEHCPLKQILQKKKGERQMVVTGNDAFSLGVIGADCRYYAAYPMTPSSSVLGTLAALQYQTGMVVRHPEDEISVVNSAIGAAFAGARAAVGTSGGGFALMNEALSYAGVAEIGFVLFLAMRSGPATGMPTWTEQGDLLFATFAGHGEFPKIVLAPGDPEEMITLTLKAFDLADIYQTPVILLSDKFLSESHTSLPEDRVLKLLKTHKIDRGKIVAKTKQGSEYLRYKNEPDGISEQLIPGQEGIFYQANSYEHLEDSHTTESGVERIKQVNKRDKKRQTYLKKHFAEPTFYGDPKADTVFISWGSNKGPILEAMKILAEKFKRGFGYVHFTHLYPLDEEKIKDFMNVKYNHRRILIENNSHAQFGSLLRMQTGIDIKEKWLKYDGRPWWPEEIVQRLTNKS